MREIVFDTETTGMDPYTGDRLLEIGAVELVNQVPTGRNFHKYINPERDVPAEAVAVHGITTEFLKDKPVFAEIYMDFLEFIGEAQLVAHNAEFDMKFLNFELRAVGYADIPPARIVDTLLIARKKFPGSPASLDALCRRFEIDLSGRELHGALLDAQLLADVYLELMGGRQHGLGLASGASSVISNISSEIISRKNRSVREPRPHAASDEEAMKHAALIEKLNDPLW